VYGHARGIVGVGGPRPRGRVARDPRRGHRRRRLAAVAAVALLLAVVVAISTLGKSDAPASRAL